MLEDKCFVLGQVRVELHHLVIVISITKVDNESTFLILSNHLPISYSPLKMHIKQRFS